MGIGLNPSVFGEDQEQNPRGLGQPK